MEEIRKRKFAKAHINKFITIMDIGFGNCYHIKGKRLFAYTYPRIVSRADFVSFFFSRLSLEKANKVLFSGLNVFIAYVVKMLLAITLCSEICCMKIL